MAFSDEIPSLAELRRQRGGARSGVRRPRAVAGLAGSSGLLFGEMQAAFAAVEEAPAGVVVVESSAAAAVVALPELGEGAAVAEVAAAGVQTAGLGAAGLGAAGVGPAVQERAAENHAAEDETQGQRAQRSAAVWKVADLVRAVRGLVEDEFRQVTVEGEISNWRPAGSGHCYFTLKDGEAQLSVVMFRRNAGLLGFRPKDGDAVRVRGQLSVYESRGQMQLIADSMHLAGMGALLAAVQRLREKLRREGLFDRKRPLPAFPKCIGVVTSVQGAALRDIVKVCRRRHAAVKLLVYPAAVQGPNCAAEVAAGVRWFSAHADRADVVIVARGGGSWEDLHGFDDEGVARAIAECALPVIAGIGHATDSTIADAAADVCAPTPSAAAELVTAAQHRVEEHLERLTSRLQRAGEFEILRARQRFSRLGARAALGRLLADLERRAQRLDELEYRAENALARALRSRQDALRELEARLERRNVRAQVAARRHQLETLEARLRGLAPGVTAARRSQVERAAGRLEALSPLRVLQRGYALVYDSEGKLLRSAPDAAEGERLRVRLANGSLAVAVVEREE